MRKCPVCQEPMAVLEWRGLEIDHCLACGGCWLDAGELSLLLSGEPGLPQQDLVREVARSRCDCPACAGRMRRGALGGVEVDVCPDGCGLWFDRGELAALIGARATNARAAPLVRHLQELFGQTPAGST